MDTTQDFEAELAQSLDRLLNRSAHRVPQRLADSIRYSLLSPGKRVRPKLLLATGDLLGISRRASISAAVSLEMIHCFTLIHDDLPCLDDDDLRRGLPSNHRKFDEATALLAGDSLFALAFESLLETAQPSSAQRTLEAVLRLTQSIGPRGVMGGQAAESDLNPTSSLEQVLSMHARKTGELFEAAILIPRDLSTLDRESPASRALERLGRALGLAFQIADDISDFLGEDAPSVNILSYRSEQEARAIAYDPLDEAIKAITVHFDATRAQPLLQISREVAALVRPEASR